jgi:hypothetical protein
MTPKEKAISLVHKFCAENQYYERAQQCALIAVDEILDILVGIYDYDYEVLHPYWTEVKQEIEKL